MLSTQAAAWHLGEAPVQLEVVADLPLDGRPELDGEDARDGFAFQGSVGPHGDQETLYSAALTTSNF